MKRFLLITLILLGSCLSAFALDSKQLAHSEDDKFKISLPQAMEMALKGNIELQEQRKNLGISQNDIKIANALKNPQFQTNLLIGKIAKANSSQLGITLPVEITKRGARKKAAMASLDYTENKINDYEFKLKLRIRTAYFNLLVAKSDLKIMEERKELLEDLCKITRNKSKKSDSYEIDVLQADMRLKKQLIQINKAKANVRTAQYNFNRILNLENNLTLYDSKEDSLFDRAVVAEFNLPGYEALEMIKAKRDIDVAIRQRIPDVYISGGYAFAHDGTPGAYVGAGFDIPSLYMYNPEIKNARLNYEKAQLEYNSIINITKNVIHTNHDKFVIAKENVDHYDEILTESREILKLSKQRYQKGKTPLTSLIVVEHSHQELLAEYLAAIGVYYNAYIALLQEIGSDTISAVVNKLF